MEVNVDRNLFLNTAKTYTDENGEEQVGVWEMAYRHPDTHQIIFPDDEAQAGEAVAGAPAVEEQTEEQATVVVERSGNPS